MSVAAASPDPAGTAGRRGDGAAGVLAAIGAEGRVSRAEQGRQVVDGKLDEGHKVWPAVIPVAGAGAQDVGDDAVDALDLAGSVVVVVRGAEDELHPERLVQTRPEGAREARVAVRYEHVWQPYVAEHRSDEVAGRSLSRGGLGGWD